MKVLTDARVEKVLDAAYDAWRMETMRKALWGRSTASKIIWRWAFRRDSIRRCARRKNIPWNGMRRCLRRVAAAIVAALPCFSVMRQYKMQKEHRQSLGFHMAYRADSARILFKMRSSL